jgi:hypothetical protein
VFSVNEIGSLTKLEADVRLAQQYPDVPAWALSTYRHVAAELPTVWPPTPDEERLRYFTWAVRQARNCHEALSVAWDLLQAVSVFMSAVSDDLDRFRQTGRLPELGEEDFETQSQNPLLASIRSVAGAIASIPSAPTGKPLPPIRPALTARAKPAKPREFSAQHLANLRAASQKRWQRERAKS